MRLRIGGIEIDDGAHNGRRFVGYAGYSEPSDFDHAFDRFRRAHDQPSIRGAHISAIISDQPRTNGKMPDCAACNSASTNEDFPEADGPRMRTARAPTSTADA